MNETEQHQIANRLRLALNEATERLPNEVLDSLRKNRMAAVDTFRIRQERQNSGFTHTLALAAQPLRVVAIAMALSLGLVGTYYWDQFDQANEYEEIDSALLSDELPPEIYSDTGFHSWLERSRSSSH
ncbi:MAG: DUF3619 family protein [Rhodocyclaceae bacterium]|nr:DUF3619 family protein [Rhodocyclaceae bacterium]